MMANKWNNLTCGESHAVKFKLLRFVFSLYLLLLLLFASNFLKLPRKTKKPDWCSQSKQSIVCASHATRIYDWHTRNKNYRLIWAFTTKCWTNNWLLVCWFAIYTWDFSCQTNRRDDSQNESMRAEWRSWFPLHMWFNRMNSNNMAIKACIPCHTTLLFCDMRNSMDDALHERWCANWILASRTWGGAFEWEMWAVYMIR